MDSGPSSSSGEMKWPLTPPLGSEPAPWRSPRAVRVGDEDAFGVPEEPRQAQPVQAEPIPWSSLGASWAGLQGTFSDPPLPRQSSDLSEIEPAPLQPAPKSVRASPAKPKRKGSAGAKSDEEVCPWSGSLGGQSRDVYLACNNSNNLVLEDHASDDVSC